MLPQDDRLNDRLNQPSKVLLIEDHKFLRELYAKNLRRRDYDVEIAKDGEDGLEKLKSFKPDVILLDIIMPDMSGIEVLKELKSNSKYKKIPVILLTAVNEIDKIRECLGTGALGYIIKGTSTEEMVNKVEMIFGSIGVGRMS